MSVLMQEGVSLLPTEVLYSQNGVVPIMLIAWPLKNTARRLTNFARIDINLWRCKITQTKPLCYYVGKRVFDSRHRRYCLILKNKYHGRKI